MNLKTWIKRFLCIVLACLSLTVILSGCAEKVKDPILGYGEQGVSLQLYEFMLSRMKGTLARNKYDVGPESEFWSQKHAASGLTNEEYYNKSVLDTCRNYLAALVIFEENGLELSSAVLADINEEIDYYIEYDCGGSEEKFDALLSKYGTDTDGLRKIYETEAKYQAVIAHLYGEGGSQISDSVKEEYYRENYHRFKQILVANFYYEYQVDEYGIKILFDPETGKPVYDTKNGKPKFDESERMLRDSYEVPIYFDKDGKPLYDAEKGLPAPTVDEDSKPIKHKFSDEEMKSRAEAVQRIAEAASDGNYSSFEGEMDNWLVYEGAEEYYTDGYYFSDIESAGYDDNMLEMLSRLKDMEIGDVSVIENEESGYHIIMKYELDKGKFSDSDYGEWFASFNNSLITKLFIDKCESFYTDIAEDAENLKKAKSIRSVMENYNY